MPVESINYLINQWRDDLARIEKEHGAKITLKADKTLAGPFILRLIYKINWVDPADVDPAPARSSRARGRPADAPLLR